MKLANEVKTFWVEQANLYKTPEGGKIASLSMSKIGYIITWHETIPTKISGRLSTIWHSREAAEHIIAAAWSETVEDKARKENGQ
jgi:hypothetical protein